MGILIYLINLAFSFAFFIIIAQAALSWLIAFDIVKTNSPQAKNLIHLLYKLTEPVYSRVRKFIPMIGGIDLTPLVVFIALSILKQLIIGALVSTVM